MDPIGWSILNTENDTRTLRKEATPLALLPPARFVPRIFGVSTIGPLHVQRGIPCQDACSYLGFENGTGVIAVADGLGSAPRSDRGATLASQTVCRFIEQANARASLSVDQSSSLLNGAASAARSALERLSTDLACELRELATTLIIVILFPDSVAACHIGDGAVVARTTTGLRIVSGPADSEYVNEVLPLTSSEWEGALRMSTIVTEATAVAVFTDGCQRATFLKGPQGVIPFGGFFDPVFSFADEVADLQDGKEQLAKLLTSAKISDNSEDDKTFVVAIPSAAGTL